MWRIVTTFLFFGTFGFNFLFNMIFTYRYCRYKAGLSPKNVMILSQDAGRGKFSGEIFWLCDDVSVWGSLHDHLRLLRQPSLPRPGFHHHACLCLGEKESVHKVTAKDSLDNSNHIDEIPGWTSLVSWHSTPHTFPGFFLDSPSSWATLSVLTC